MFAVIFEVNPRPEAWDEYLGHAAMLRPELLAIDGFIANERYRNLHRPGWLVSLSIWRDEKALIRWRTHALHHAIQGKGRSSVFADYHLRVGEIVSDTEASEPLPQHRFDTTEAPAKAVCITERALAEWPRDPSAERPRDPSAERPRDPSADGRGDTSAERPGDPSSDGPGDPSANRPGDTSCQAPGDVFDSITRPGNALYLRSCPDLASAHAVIAGATGRHRVVRVIRDYGMFARAEAPQYFPRP